MPSPPAPRAALLPLLLLLLLLLPLALAHAARPANTTLSVCRLAPPAPRTSFFTASHPLPAAALPQAHRYLRLPHLARLLLGHTLLSARRRSPDLWLLRRHDGSRCLLRVEAARRAVTVVSVVRHDRAFFPAAHRATVFFARVRRRRLHLSFRAGGAAPRRATNVHARALVLDALSRARVALAARACSRALPELTAICNNPRNIAWGASRALQRRLRARSAMRIDDARLPNPRAVSNRLCKQRRSGGRHAPREVNFLMVIFGQFVDHDIVLTPSGAARREASFDVPGRAAARMRFFRSDILGLPRCCEVDNRRHGKGTGPFNEISAFIDASAVYGESYQRGLALRSFRGGKLTLTKVRDQLLLPRNKQPDLPYLLDNANRRGDSSLFAAGDIRANENPVLTSLHTVFAREHNRICDILRDALKGQGKRAQSDEWLYQQARRVVIAELQSIVFNEFVPAMLGENALGNYEGYDVGVDAGMDVVFTTAAYRWGHSAIREDLLVRRLDGSKGKHRLMDGFFNPQLFQTETVEAWLLGAMRAPAMNIDLQHSDSVRDFLFSPGKRGRLDLVALNVQRGRDHSLPGYLDAREAYGLKRGLGDVPARTRRSLLRVYKHADRIDTFIGGLSERKVGGSLLGPLFHEVVARQFRRLRDGDRFYYENVKWGKFMGELDIVKRIRSGDVRLKDILLANTRIVDKDLVSSRGAMAWK